MVYLESGSFNRLNSEICHGAPCSWKNPVRGALTSIVTNSRLVMSILILNERTFIFMHP